MATLPYRHASPLKCCPVPAGVYALRTDRAQSVPAIIVNETIIGPVATHTNPPPRVALRHTARDDARPMA